MSEKIRVVTSFGGWFDMDKPEEFQMFPYVQAIRAAGYILNGGSYVPHEHIVSIFLYNTDNPPAPPQGMPAGGTLQ